MIEQGKQVEVDISDRITIKPRIEQDGVYIDLYFLHKKLPLSPIQALGKILIKEEELKEIEKEAEVIKIKEAIKKYNIEPHTLCEKWGFA